MNISKKDFALLTGMVEFHFKFAEYIRENVDNELFYRAIDYAKTYAKVDGMEFNYWHEDNEKFLDELLHLLEKRTKHFARLVEKVGKEEAENMYIRRKKTTREDPLGLKNYLENFIRHARELDYEQFKMEDWVNYVRICSYIKDDPKFIDFAAKQLAKVIGTDNDLYRSLTNGTQS